MNETKSEEQIAERQALAAEIRAALGRAGKPQRELADMLGWPPKRLSTRMQGQQPFTLEEVQKIADHLGLTLYDLLPKTHAHR